MRSPFFLNFSRLCLIRGLATAVGDIREAGNPALLQKGNSEIYVNCPEKLSHIEIKIGQL